MGSLAAARRTQSSYSALLETTNPSQIVLATAIASPAIGNGQGYDPAIVREIARIPHVTAVASATGINAEPLGPNGAPIATGSVPRPGRLQPRKRGGRVLPDRPPRHQCGPGG